LQRRIGSLLLKLSKINYTEVSPLTVYVTVSPNSLTLSKLEKGHSNVRIILSMNFFWIFRIVPRNLGIFFHSNSYWDSPTYISWRLKIGSNNKWSDIWSIKYFVKTLGSSGNYLMILCSVKQYDSILFSRTALVLFFERLEIKYALLIFKLSRSIWQHSLNATIPSELFYLSFPL